MTYSPRRSRARRVSSRRRGGRYGGSSPRIPVWSYQDIGRIAADTAVGNVDILPNIGTAGEGLTLPPGSELGSTIVRVRGTVQWDLGASAQGQSAHLICGLAVLPQKSIAEVDAFNDIQAIDWMWGPHVEYYAPTDGVIVVGTAQAFKQFTIDSRTKRRISEINDTLAFLTWRTGQTDVTGGISGFFSVLVKLS